MKRRQNQARCLVIFGSILAMTLLSTCFNLVEPTDLEAQAPLPPRIDIPPDPPGRSDFYSSPYVNNDFEPSYPVYYKRRAGHYSGYQTNYYGGSKHGYPY